MQIRLGNQTDLEETHQILKEVAHRLKKQGSTQWSHIIEDREVKTLLLHLKNDEVLVFENKQQIIGLAYLYKTPNDWDKELWQSELSEGVYYLHKVAIRDANTGQKVGSELLSTLISWVEKEKGHAIRLDCMADIEYLNQFYKKAGFKFKEKKLKSNRSNLPADFNLYEYVIA